MNIDVPATNQEGCRKGSAWRMRNVWKLMTLVTNMRHNAYKYTPNELSSDSPVEEAVAEISDWSQYQTDTRKLILWFWNTMLKLLQQLLLSNDREVIFMWREADNGRLTEIQDLGRTVNGLSFGAPENLSCDLYNETGHLIMVRIIGLIKETNRFRKQSEHSAKHQIWKQWTRKTTSFNRT